MARLNAPLKVAQPDNLDVRAGMDAMSAKFKSLGSDVYVDSEKVKESNKAL